MSLVELDLRQNNVANNEGTYTILGKISTLNSLSLADCALETLPRSASSSLDLFGLTVTPLRRL